MRKTTQEVKIENSKVLNWSSFEGHITTTGCINKEVSITTAKIVDIDLFRFIKESDAPFILVGFQDASDFEFVDMIELKEKVLSMKDLESVALKWIDVKVIENKR